VEIHREFKEMDQGEPKVLLGIELNCNQKSHFDHDFTRSIYWQDLMEDCKSVTTPLPTIIQ